MSTTVLTQGVAKQEPQPQALRRASTGFKQRDDGLIAFDVRKIDGLRMSVPHPLHRAGGRQSPGAGIGNLLTTDGR